MRGRRGKGDKRPLDVRFHDYYVPEPNTGCWLWTGAASVRPGNGGGYGQIRDGGQVLSTHRLSWEMRNGPIPPGLMVCHRCDVRLCVNPQHLFLGSHLDNMADMRRKGRQAHGEAFVAATAATRARGDRNGARTHPETRARGDRNGARTSASKLNREKADEIRRLCESGRTQRAVAKEFGVTFQMVSRIMRGIAWVPEVPCA